MATSELNVLHCSTFNNKFKINTAYDNDWRKAAWTIPKKATLNPTYG